jgi:hypothetical protein
MENTFIRAEDVAKELDISKAYAYKVIRRLNAELETKGFLTIPGRISLDYFFERFYGIRKGGK